MFSNLSKNTLYLIRCAGLGAFGGLLYTYYCRRKNQNILPQQIDAKTGSNLKVNPYASQTLAQPRSQFAGIANPCEILSDDTPIKTASEETRSQFIKKVYGAFALQVGAVALTTVAAFKYPALFKRYAIPATIIGTIGAFGSIIAMNTQAVRTSERNKKICLGAFTLSEMLATPLMITRFPADLVFSAFTGTGLITGGLTLYATTTKRDFTPFEGYIFGGLLAFIGLTLGAAFFPRFIQSRHLAWMGAGLFSFILAHDTQKVFGKGKSVYKYGEYDKASVAIYLDVLNLFLQILQIMDSSHKK